MKLFKKLVILTLALCIAFPAQARHHNDVREMGRARIVTVDASKYQGEYDRALEADPWKGWNLAMFKFNNAVDQFFVAPLARAYRFAMPKWGRDRVSNFFNTLEESTNFVNSILQGDVEGMFRSFWRFTINATFGIGGMHDVAAGFGLHEKDRTFSQTLALYGVESGPYLVLPFMGPSTPRDLFGTVADAASEPTTYASGAWPYAVSGLHIISMREGLLNFTDDVDANSFDPYSTYKSSYLQNRKKKVVRNIAD